MQAAKLALLLAYFALLLAYLLCEESIFIPAACIFPFPLLAYLYFPLVAHFNIALLLANLHFPFVPVHARYLYFLR